MNEHIAKYSDNFKVSSHIGNSVLGNSMPLRVSLNDVIQEGNGSEMDITKMVSIYNLPEQNQIKSFSITLQTLWKLVELLSK